MSGVSCLCSVAVGGGGPPSRGVSSFPFSYSVCCAVSGFASAIAASLSAGAGGSLRSAAGFGLGAYTGGVPVPFPAAVGGGMLVVRPGTVQARRATSARSFLSRAERNQTKGRSKTLPPRPSG